MNKLCLLLLSLCLAACVPVPAGQQESSVRTSARSVIAARQAAMHMSTTLMVRGIRAALKSSSDIRDQEAAAQGIAMWAQAIPGMFPPGSAGPDSRARPDIWTNKADFDARADALGAAALHLAELAHAGDRTGVAKQVEVVQSRCAECHQRYRSEP